MKSPKDVLGFQINCPSYTMCPLCYGCRNYRSDLDECKKCATNFKQNICNTKLHKSNLIAKMILKNEIEIKEKVNFINENEEE